MTHSFHVEIAVEYGVTKAILLEYLCFWQQKNEANKRHFHDGKYWVYNSIRAFHELFPYLSEKQIRYALKSLEEEGAIYTGSYNKNKYDRTVWYSVDMSIYQKVIFHLTKGQMEKTESVNQNAQKGEPIPASNTYSNTSSDTSSDMYAQSCKDSSEPPILSIPLAGKDKFFDVTQTMVDEWQEDFPGVDILRELRKCRAWNKANPARRKTLRGIRRHIVSWLSRAQDSPKAPPAGNKPPRCLLEPEGGFENKVYVGATPPEELANISWLQDDDDDEAMEA